MQLTEYSHNDAVEKIDPQILEEVRNLITDCEPSDTWGSSELKDIFYEKGWSGEYQIDMVSKTSITSTKEMVGICIQFGNIARGFYDLAKLDALFRRGIIEVGVLVCPALNEGGNTVHFNRIESELANIFNETITVPILIIGIE